MNKYMMFGRQLDVHVMEEVHQETFKHGNRDWKFVPTQVMFRNKINAQEKTPEQRKARVEGLLQKEKERRDRLKELEIAYDFPGFSALVEKKSARKQEPAVQAVVLPKKDEKKANKKVETPVPEPEPKIDAKSKSETAKPNKKADAKVQKATESKTAPKAEVKPVKAAAVSKQAPKAISKQKKK